MLNIEIDRSGKTPSTIMVQGSMETVCFEFLTVVNSLYFSFADNDPRAAAVFRHLLEESVQNPASPIFKHREFNSTTISFTLPNK